MAVLYYQNELGMDHADGYNVVAGSTIGDPRAVSCGSNTYDTDWGARRSMGIRTDGGTSSVSYDIGRGTLTTPAIWGQGKVWVHFVSGGYSCSGTNKSWQLGLHTGTELPIRWNITNSGCNFTVSCSVQDSSGSHIGNALGVSTSAKPTRYDTCIDFDTNLITMWVDGVKNNEVVYDFSRYAQGQQLPQVWLGGGYLGNEDRNLSEIIITQDEQTIGWRVATIYPTSAGTDSDWTGTYEDIDDVALDVSTYLETSTAGTSTFNFSPMPSGGIEDFSIQDYEIHSVKVSSVGHAEIGAVAPNVVDVVRSNGTIYEVGSNIDQTDREFLSDTYKEMTVNPDTGLPWTIAEIDACEFGVRAS